MEITDAVKTVKCPECGRDLEEAISEAYENPKFEFSGNGDVDLSVTCECGKELEEVFTYFGMWDPKEGEYIFEY